MKSTLATVFALLSADEHPVHWVSKSPSSHGLVGRQAKTIPQFQQHAESQAGWNFYVSLNPSLPTPYKPSKNHITHLCCLGIDIDPLPGKDLDISGTCKHLDESLTAIIGPAKHIIYDSGRGIWAWVLIEPTPLMNKGHRDEADSLIKGFTRCIADTCGLGAFGLVDTSCAELSRIARCPGTINQKTGKQAAFLTDYPLMRLPYHLLAEIAAPYVLPVPEERPPLLVGASVMEVAPALNATSRQFVLLGVSKADESRHRRLWSTAKNMLELGISPATAHLVLSAGANLCRPSLFSDDPTCVDKVLSQLWGRP
jgi:hypothetical protein